MATPTAPLGDGDRPLVFPGSEGRAGLSVSTEKLRQPIAVRDTVVVTVIWFASVAMFAAPTVTEPPCGRACARTDVI